MFHTERIGVLKNTFFFNNRIKYSSNSASQSPNMDVLKSASGRFMLATKVAGHSYLHGALTPQSSLYLFPASLCSCGKTAHQRAFSEASIAATQPSRTGGEDIIWKRKFQKLSPPSAIFDNQRKYRFSGRRRYDL